MKERLSEKFAEFIRNNNLSLGFIQPGHGAKGRQIQVSSDEDLTMMYEHHKGKKHILLWIKVHVISQTGRGTKRPLSAINTPNDGTSTNVGTKKTSSNYQSHIEKMSEVQSIVAELDKRHGTIFTKEQLTAWAHMIGMKKHDSYDEPPKKPFFKTKKVIEKYGNTLSPGKRISYRSECIDQLDKWHTLLEKGAISHVQFEELQATILGDIKKF